MDEAPALALSGPNGRFAVAEYVDVLRLKALPRPPLAANVDHRLVFLGIADDRHWLLTALHPIHLLDQHLAVEHNAFVAARKMLLRTIRDRALPDPADHVLSRDIVGDNLALVVEQVRVFDGRRPWCGGRLPQCCAIRKLKRMSIIDRDAE